MRLLLVTHLLLWAGVCQANGAAIDETDRSLTSQHQVQVTCPDKDDLSTILLENNWRTQNEIAAMSEEDKRNTIIVETEKMTGHTRADLEGRNNAGNVGSLTAIANMATLLVKYSIKRSSDVKTMTYEPHLRNSIIGEISQVFSMQPSTLHSKTDHQLLKMFCGQFDHCQTGKGADYFGTVGKTKSGHTCLPWTFQSSTFKSLGGHNYCRNPNNAFNDDGVWCYTYTGGIFDWEFCNVPVCDVTLDPERKHEWIKLSADKLQAEGYCSVQSTVPVQHSTFYYFEMTVVTGQMPVIGLASHQFNLDYMPGSEDGSYGYWGDIGEAGTFSEWKNYGDPYSAGDTVGCGFIPGSGQLFFTKNGEYQGEAFRVPNTAVELYPTFNIDGKVEVNFGNKKFVFERWVQTKFDDCWSDCGEKGGPCPSFCGSDGYCCRKGYGGCPVGAGEDSPDIHTCFAKIG